MKLRNYLKNNILYLDGGMGTLLFQRGLNPGELPERWNITRKEVVRDIHKAYFDAGSNVVSTNTFGANSLKFSEEELDEIIKNAVKNAKDARKESKGVQPKWVALDIGPLGKLLKPYGELEFEDAVNAFAKTVRLGVKYGVDLVIIETMNDAYETKAAVVAVKENCNLPVFVSNAYGEDGNLISGASPEVCVATLEGLGVDAIGVNCSFGPEKLAPVVEKYLNNASVPVLFKPNAGLPRVENGKTVYDVDAEAFSWQVRALVEKGVRIVGGCCGTTPEYIARVKEQTENITPVKIVKKNSCVITSGAKLVDFDERPILIGERINPTGKKAFKEALRNHDVDYILKEGIGQAERGVHALDVNVGLPEIDEVSMLEEAVVQLQSVVDLPLQIDTSNALAMQKAMRVYNGKALINSVNGKRESMDAVFPLVKKYGGVVLALTLDENGIPSSAKERVEIAKKILKEAKRYGLSEKDIIFDPLALTISADDNSAKETLEAVKLIRNKLKCHTSLGVSNVSFGLPRRDAINGTFFAMALNSGLSASIMNPYSDEMMKTYYAYKALSGNDKSCLSYVNYAQNTVEASVSQVKTEGVTNRTYASELQRAIILGLKEQAGIITDKLLRETSALDIINDEIVPALDTVGQEYENKRLFLPQLLMSAESAKRAFESIKNSAVSVSASKCTFVIATVKGDIHDIGKNVVKLLLENYGYDVIDLGKDVEPMAVVEKVVEVHAPIVGLSALMTTTVPAMEQTVKLLKEKAPWCKVVVGGAVLTEEYARKIGADKYCKDAMDTVRYAEGLLQ